MQHLKILFFIPTLSGGGAERVTLQLLQHIDRNKYAPHLLLFDKEGQYIEALPSSIPIFELKKRRSRKAFPLFAIFSLKKIIKREKPDVILSLMCYTNALALIAKIMSRVKPKTIISERTSTYIYAGRFINFLRNLTIRFLYPTADEIIFPSQDMADTIVEFRRIKKKVTIIPNPVDVATVTEYAQEIIEDPIYRESNNIVIAIGRLSKEKGFLYLIKAIALLSKQGIDCKLVILGEGVEYKNLQSLSKELGIEDRVHLLGFKLNPYKYLARSTIFVLSSLYEGFPNVLLEAMALGVPSIATRCPTGPEEIITDEVNGLLIPPADEKSLAHDIKRLLLDRDLRKRLSENARKKAADFRVEKIIKHYEDVIDNVCFNNVKDEHGKK
jgi:glycosyltransferase involved in cell wall biosynthesis